jgi:hypothetical protein
MRTGGVGSTGQQVPSDGQAVGKSDLSSEPPPGPPPPGATLASATLASLLDAQQAKPSASDLASKLVSAADADGDGSLSLDEITQALSGKQKGGASKTSDAFNSLDADSDGKLSAGELTAGLQKMMTTHHNHGHGHAHAYGRVGRSQELTPTTTPPITPGETTTAATSTEPTPPVDATV